MNLDDKVEIRTKVDVSDIKQGPIPYIVPLFRRNGRYWAGDDVFRQRAEVLKAALKEHSNDDAIRVVAKWGNTYYDLPVAVTSFENLVKIQKESGFMQGMEGITTDDAMVAVAADEVRRSVKPELFEKYFKVTSSAKVKFGLEGNLQEALVKSIVLFPYDRKSIELNADQFGAIAAEAVARPDFLNGDDLELNQIIQRKRLVYPYSAILPEDVGVSLVRNTFKFNGRVYNYDANEGLYLADMPAKNRAEMRALCAGRLDCGSRLDASVYLGSVSRLVGVVRSIAAGDAKN